MVNQKTALSAVFLINLLNSRVQISHRQNFRRIRRFKRNCSLSKCFTFILRLFFDLELNFLFTKKSDFGRFSEIAIP